MKLSLNKLTKAMSLSLLTSSLLLAQAARAEAEQRVSDQDESQIEVDQSSDSELDESEIEQEVEVIKVTGSRINQTTLEGPLPVEIISADDMLKAGNMTVYDALQNLTQNTGSVTADENSNGFTPNAKVLNFRGLGPQYTLVLINGRRIANYPQAYKSNATVVNVNSVPMAAVERIEVVSTGASAIYGSDAAAAVINVILKKDFEGLSMGGTLGTPDNVDGDSMRFNIVKGFDFDNGNITAVMEYTDSDDIYGPSDMDYPYGTPVMNRGAVVVNALAAQGYDAFYNNIPEDMQPPTYVDPGKDACDSIPGMEYQSRARNEDSSTPGSFGSYCGLDIGKRSTIRNGSEKISAMISSNFDLDNDISVFADFIFTNVQASNDRGYINLQGMVEEPGTTPPLIELPWGTYPGTDFGYQHNLQSVQRLFASEEIGNTGTDFDENAYSFTVGVEGLLMDEYDWEVSYTNSRYTLDTERTLADYKKVEEYFFGENVVNNNGDNVTYLGNPLYDGNSLIDVFTPLDAVMIDDIFGRGKEKNETYSDMVTAVISGEAFDWYAGTVQFAAVLEYMNEGFDYKADEKMEAEDGEGWWNFAGFSGEGDRDRYSVGLEVQVPLLDNLSTTMALRYDEYHSTGPVNGDWTPAISLEYRPMDDLLVRASYSGIFRAPDLQAIYTESSFYTSGIDYLTCYEQQYAPDNITPEDFETGSKEKCFTYNSGFKADKLPASDLKNETGDSYGIGIVWEPIDNLAIKFDYYDTEINNQIQQASSNGLLYDEFLCAYEDEVTGNVTFGCEKVNQLVNRGPNEPGFGQTNIEKVNTTPFNLAMHRQTGTDAKISYRFETADYGFFNTSIAHTGIISTERDTIEGDGIKPTEYHDELWNNEPIDTIVGTLGWAYEDFTANVTVRYQSGLGPRRRAELVNENGDPRYFDSDGKEVDYVDLNEDGQPVDAEGEVIENVNTKLSNKRLDPYITTNLVLGYTFNEGDTRVNFTVNNLFDENSPEDDSWSYNEWPWYNISAYAGSAIGREFYLGFEHNF
ncbi:TonB-dependent receptor domain-containing protein [Thalassotalea crassostreae]|uniref:TonB-dependent receptor domain-containing protein n=1 Tax=Thalassotalea crassostreae TaxID=1763536 RepID=UPI0008393DF1|nr:TonB-dependent receptor [Thalassotalea crassostreae]